VIPVPRSETLLPGTFSAGSGNPQATRPPLNQALIFSGSKDTSVLSLSLML
jgi:hypothetical protein